MRYPFCEARIHVDDCKRTRSICRTPVLVLHSFSVSLLHFLAVHQKMLALILDLSQVQYKNKSVSSLDLFMTAH